jgi:hypothetical protein
MKKRKIGAKVTLINGEKGEIKSKFWSAKGWLYVIILTNGKIKNNVMERELKEV